jgi:methionyl-tRNA formyltransferase
LPGAAFGETLAVDKEGITVACGDGALVLQELKPAGKGAMPADAFAHGRHVHKGTRWGSA